MFKEKMKLKGTITLVARHANGKIFARRTIKNTVTAAGKAVVAALMVGDVGGTAFDAIAIGTGTGGTTALNAEATTNGGARRSGANVVGTVPSGSTGQWVTTFTFTGALAITEEGILNNSSGGTLLAYQSFAAINVANTDTLTITHQVALS
jgi:hypothetical protein